jgi:hypothetical protein
VSGNLLTIAIGIAGVTVSVLCSLVAFKLGVRQASSQKTEFVDETNRQKAELSLEIHEVRSVLSTVVRSIESRTMTTVDSTARRPSNVRQDNAGGVEAERSSTTELLVRASLGALLDERGEVRVQRLFEEVSSALGVSSSAGAISALQHLREAGVVDWDGSPDLFDVVIVRVRPPGGHRSDWSTAKAGGDIKV